MNICASHQLRYAYTAPVTLGPHTLCVHPRPGATLRVVRFELTIDPTPAQLIRNLDAEGNVQYLAFFRGQTEHLHIQAESEVSNTLGNPFDFVLFPFETQRIPFVYKEAQRAVLQPYLSRQDVTPAVEAFARSVAEEAGWDTVGFLTHLNGVIRRGFGYEIREQGKPHTPEQTLLDRRGSCRDYTVLYAAACRSLGLAARFVSGYHLGTPAENRYLHAWAEVYLPGAGWRGFDPTQNCLADHTYVPLAASARPELVTPSKGTFSGKARGPLQTRLQILPADAVLA
jgi:transglutaminase-like putative cysteine protease